MVSPSVSKLIPRIGIRTAVNGLADPANHDGRSHLGSLDRVTRIVRLGVMIATSGDVRNQLKLADAAAEFMGRVGAEFDIEAGSKAARLVALNALAASRNHLGLFLLASSDCAR